MRHPPAATANTNDPDSRHMHGRHGSVQGYNAQAIATTDQIIIAAGLTQTSNDLRQLAPMLTATRTTLAAAGITSRPEVLLADSGYWSIANLTSIPDAPELLIAPAKHAREGKPRKDGSPSASRSTGLRAAMAAKLTSRDARPATRCASKASNRSSGRSKRFAAPAGSNDAAWAPAWPNGNCSAAPTTFSNSGVRAPRPEAAVRLASSPRPMSGSGPHPPT
jgi:hypothetical protein